MLRLLSCVLLGAVFCGCSVSEEDKAFYYSGWIDPNKKKVYDERANVSRNPPGNNYRPDPLDQ